MELSHVAESWFPLTSPPHKTQPVYVRATAPLPAEENAAQLWTMDRGYLVNKRTAYGIYVILLEKEGEGGCVIPLLRVAYTPSFESAWYKKWYSFQNAETCQQARER